MSDRGCCSGRSASCPRSPAVFTAGAVLLVLELLIDADWINAYLVPPPSAVLLSFARVITEEHIAERFLLTSAEALGTGLLLAAVGIPLGLLLFRFRCCAARPKPGSRPSRRRRWCSPIRCSWSSSGAAP